MSNSVNRPHIPVTEERIEQWEQSALTDCHDAAAEIRRLQARERQLLEMGNKALELRRASEQTVAIRDVQIAALERWIRKLINARACTRFEVAQVHSLAGCDSNHREAR